MKITFTETEESDRRLFEEALGGHELSFVDALADVTPETEVLSIFKAANIDDAFLAQHPALRLIATRSTTTDHIDIESCARRSVAVCDVPSYGDHIVAEHTFALLLALTRRLREAMHLNGNKRFSYEALRGTELHGKTFGILGAGRVGMKTIPIARAFGMEVIAHDIEPRPAEAASLGFAYVSFDELLRRSHFLSLHTPLTGDTFHTLDRETFAKCRRGVLIINTARGRLIDRLLARPNVVFTPHIAFNCVESIERINAATAANIKRFIARTPLNVVRVHEIEPQTSVQPSDELCLTANI